MFKKPRLLAIHQNITSLYKVHDGYQSVTVQKSFWADCDTNDSKYRKNSDISQIILSERSKS